MKAFNKNTQPQRLTTSTFELLDFEDLSIHEESINETDKKSSLQNKKEFNFSQQNCNDLINHILQTNDCDQSFNISNENRENPVKELSVLNHLTGVQISFRRFL